MNSQGLPGCFWLILIIIIIGGLPLLKFVFTALLVISITAIFLAWLGANILVHKFKINDYLKTQTDSHNKFGELLIKYMVAVAKADGSVDEGELNIIRGFFRTHLRYRSAQMLWVEKLINDAIKHATPLNVLNEEFNSSFGLDEKRILFQLLLGVANADGSIHKNEEKIIRDIALSLNFPNAELDFLFKNFSRKSSVNPYEVLGLNKNAASEEIKKRYRILCREHHPDKVAHLGAEFQKEASEKMAVINNAYNELKKQGAV